MVRATPETREVAKLLMACECEGLSDQQKKKSSKLPARGDLFSKVAPHLVPLMGKAGFGALVGRAIALAKAEAPWLGELKIKADGTLEGVAHVRRQLERESFLEGQVIVLAHLLDLLLVFIGNKLTLQLVRQIWPEASLKDSHLLGGENDG